MILKKLTLLSVMAMLCLGFSALGQEKFNAKVIDAQTKAPLAGATVKVTTPPLTASTDKAGNIAMALPPGKYQLQVQYLSFEEKRFEITLPLKEPLIIELSPNTMQLNEVQIVSTGYQTLPKERANGSFVQISQQQLERTPTTAVLDRLKDIVPGLTFNTKGNSSISIRGQSTIFSNAEPLIVLDNFPYDGNINSINPNDIESITVLRDAAAASIWGARAGNGVIIVTTKNGQKNSQPAISMRSSTTLTEKPDLFYFNSLSSKNAIEVEQYLFNKGYYTVTENSVNKTALSPVVELLVAKRNGNISQQKLDSELAQLASKDVRNDALRYMYQTGLWQQYVLNLNGGTENHTYYLSGGYDFNRSANVGNHYERATINFRNHFTLLNKKLEVGTAITYGLNKTQNRNSGLQSIRMTGTIPLYPYASLADDAGNPLSITKDIRVAAAVAAMQKGLLDWQYYPLTELKMPGSEGQSTDQRMQLNLKYQLPFGLSATALMLYGRNNEINRNLRTLGSYSARNEINRLTQVNADGSFSYPVPMGDILDKEDALTSALNFRGQLNMDRNWGRHELNAIAGYERRSVNKNADIRRLYGYDSEHETYKIVNYNTTYPLYLNPASTANVIPYIDQLNGTTDNFLSYYANAGYVFNKKYSVNASARKDESNLFGVNANQKGVPLYSVGLGWLMSNETFFKSNILNYLKLRASFGYNGNINQAVSAYTTATYYAGNGARQLTRLPYAAVNNPPNPDLRWERIKIYNVGLDYAAFENKVTGTIELYRKKGIDLIGNTIYPPSSGISSFRGNFANTLTQGVDLNTTINWGNKKTNNPLKWSTSAIFSFLKESVTAYFVETSAATSVTTQASAQVVGKPLFAIYSFQNAGLDPLTGDPQFYNNGQITKDYAKLLATTNWDDIKYHGSARPTLFGALRNDITFRNLNLSFNLNYKLGYYFRRQSVVYSSILTGAYGGNFGNDYELRWKTPGDESFTKVPSLPAATNANRDKAYEFSDVLVEKADHIRLQDIRLAYRLDKGINRLAIKRFELFAYLNNGFILWRANKSGLDPDSPITLPQVRTYAFGIKLDL